MRNFAYYGALITAILFSSLPATASEEGREVTVERLVDEVDKEHIKGASSFVSKLRLMNLLKISYGKVPREVLLIGGTATTMWIKDEDVGPTIEVYLPDRGVVEACRSILELAKSGVQTGSAGLDNVVRLFRESNSGRLDVVDAALRDIESRNGLVRALSHELLHVAQLVAMLVVNGNIITNRPLVKLGKRVVLSNFRALIFAATGRIVNTREHNLPLAIKVIFGGEYENVPIELVPQLASYGILGENETSRRFLTGDKSLEGLVSLSKTLLFGSITEDKERVKARMMDLMTAAYEYRNGKREKASENAYLLVSEALGAIERFINLFG